MQDINHNKIVSSFEQACEQQGTIPENEIPFPFPKNKRQHSQNGYAKLCLIRLAINRPDYDPDSNDVHEPKWKCYWEYNQEIGFFFYCSGCGYPETEITGGPLLDCETKEIADYFALQFEKEWKEFLQ